MNVLTNGHGYNLRKHWDDIVERIGSFVPASLRAIYGNLTDYHLVTYIIKCLPLILYTVNFIRNLYKESRKRVQTWEAEIKDIQLKLDLILCQEEEVKQELRDREETLRRATEQYHRVRAQVRQIIARSDSHELKLPIDIAHLHLNRTSEEESKLLEELIKDSNYEKEEPVDENTFNKFYDRADTVDTKDSTIDSKGGRGYTVKFVKVTNVYKMSYLQHHYKQKRLQREKRAELNKKTNSIKILFNEWNNSLNAVTKKVYSVDSGISTEAIDDNLLHDEKRNEHVEERNESQDDFHIQNQCLTYGNYSDEDIIGHNRSEIMAMDYTTKIFDNRRNYTWADQALPALPEETSSEIDIQELDLNVNIFDKI